MNKKVIMKVKRRKEREKPYFFCPKHRQTNRKRAQTSERGTIRIKVLEYLGSTKKRRQICRAGV